MSTQKIEGIKNRGKPTAACSSYGRCSFSGTGIKAGKFP